MPDHDQNNSVAEYLAAGAGRVSGEAYGDKDIQVLIDSVNTAKERFKLTYKYHFDGRICHIWPDVYQGVTFTDTPDIFLYIVELR